jgi:enediyne biosynthesis protein E4
MKRVPMSSQPSTPSGHGIRAALAALLLAGLGAVGVVFWQVHGEGALKDAIQRATAAKQWAAVESGLRRWLNDHPRDGAAWEMLGGLLLDQDRQEQALEALGRVRSGDTGWVHAQTLIGEIALRRHQLAEAERILRQAALRAGRDIEPLKRLSSLLVLELRPAEAREVLRQIFKITRDPRHLADSLLISQLDSEVRDLSPEVEAHLRHAADDPWLRRVWGLYLLSHSRPAEALPHLEAAARNFEDDPLGRFALAECQMAVGIHGDDLSILGNPPARSADAARWWIFRSRLAEAWKQDDEAFKSLNEAIAHDSRNAEAHYRLGQLLSRRGQESEGRVHLDRATALGIQEDELRRELRRVVRDGADVASMRRIGQLCREAGMAAEANEWFALVGPSAASSSSVGSAERTDLGPGASSVRTADPTGLSPTPLDDGPSVALSRPRLRTADPPLALASPVPKARGSHAFPQFEDVARRVGVSYRYDCGATPNLFIGDTMGGGVALFDLDNDGWLDIYFVNGCALPFDRRSPPRPSTLYRNQGDGTFEDITQRAGVAGRGYGMGCAVGDFDNDGHDDLFVTGLNQTVLYRNRGDGTFEDVTERSGVASSRWTTAAGFADLDGDGDLDLMVVSYVEADPEAVIECRDKSGRPIHCQPEKFLAQPDQLFRNNGNGTFTDVSHEAGIDVPEGKGLGLAIADLAGDGRLDLFVANDGTPNFLFHNRGGLRFEEIGLTAGVAYDGAGLPTASMGVVAEDLNRDGRIDLFHTNFINQSSTLRWNLGGGRYADGTLAANLAAASRSKTGFGAVALDVDNDGILDLFVANGHTDDQPWFNCPMAQTAQLFLGSGDGRFELARPESSPYLSRALVGRGVAAGDLDNDGRVDLVVVHRDAPAALLRNTTLGGHWLGLKPRGTRSPRTPVGTRVTCRAGGRSQTRWLTSGTGYLSCSDSRLWFGLGTARMVAQLEVRWPSGLVQTWSNLAGDRFMDLTEGGDPVERQVKSTR